MAKTALISGITGQDGSYLADLLLGQGYTVHGLVNRPDFVSGSNIKHLLSDTDVFNKQLFLHTAGFEDIAHLRRTIVKVHPDEFYHLAGQTSPRLSFALPETTVDSICKITLRILEILRDIDHPTKFLFASSSEVFASQPGMLQDETSPIGPKTPYGAAKAFAQQMVQIYREAHGLSVCSAILYNHESPRRGDGFVTMKVAKAAVWIKKGLQKRLKLGSLEGQRDWGWAPDYVRGMSMILKSEKVEDYVLATGKLHSVENLVETAFSSVGLNWKEYVDYDVSLNAASEPTAPCGNPAKAEKLLGWKPTVQFDEIVDRLVQSEMNKLA